MSEETPKPGYFSRLISAILGKTIETGTVNCSADQAELRSRIAALEMDLRDRDKRIAKMKTEYANLSGEKDHAGSQAGKEQKEKLFKSLTGTLSNIATITDIVKAGKEVEASEYLRLFDDLEKNLQRAGLQRIGNVGEKGKFDSTLHQRMSGGTVHQGTEIAIRIPGYRTETNVLLKAMVTAKEN